MRRRMKNEEGLLSLEACISVTIFIFFMLFMYSFFVVFEVRNAMGHATLSTANSMAFDAYENGTLGASGTVGDIMFGIYGAVTNSANDFTDHRQWYNDSNIENEEGNTSLSGKFSDVIKERYIAYLTGGKPDKAEEILKRYHVVGGVEGLDFSGSKVVDDNLYISVKYEIEYEFKVFNLGNNKFEHKVCSKLWK